MTLPHHDHTYAAREARNTADRARAYAARKGETLPPGEWPRLYFRKYRHLTGRLPFAGPKRVTNS